MKATLDDYLTVVAPHLHIELVSDRARASLHELACSLPVTDLAGFECSLGPGRSQVDLIVRLPRGPFVVPAQFADESVWLRITEFSRKLSDPASPLCSGVRVLGLEFDLPTKPPRIPIPAIFFELTHESGTAAERVLALGERLLWPAFPGELRASLRRCIESLPAGGRVVELGAMLSRPDAGLRVVVSRIPAASLPAYLQEIGWCGNRDEITSILAGIVSRADSFMLSFDIDRTVQARLGLECFLEREPDRLRRWEFLLDGLQTRGLCTTAKARALIEWHGTCRRGSCPDPWPRTLKWGDRLLAPRAVSLFARVLSHVKIVAQPERPLAAKAYLGFAHYWLDLSKSWHDMAEQHQREGLD